MMKSYDEAITLLNPSTSDLGPKFVVNLPLDLVLTSRGPRNLYHSPHISYPPCYPGLCLNPRNPLYPNSILRHLYQACEHCTAHAQHHTPAKDNAEYSHLFTTYFPYTPTYTVSPLHTPPPTPISKSKPQLRRVSKPHYIKPTHAHPTRPHPKKEPCIPSNPHQSISALASSSSVKARC